MADCEEYFDLVNEAGEVIGQAPRSQCHRDPTLLHCAVHVLVFTSAGELVLQKRLPSKDIQPDKWDTSVGGHVGLGEAPELAAEREMAEELGISAELAFCHRYIWRSDRESELITSFRTVHDGPYQPQPEEVGDARPWSLAEIASTIGNGIFTPNFEYEWQHYGHNLRSSQ
ncbi:MAG: isopentenyldiphosphate isomerase [Rhodothermales bacterium]|jgi:isopentenyldiphosphate isomerase